MQIDDPIAAANAVAASQQPSGVSAVQDQAILNTQNIVDEVNQLAAEAAADERRVKQRTDTTSISDDEFVPSGRSLRATVSDYMQPVNVSNPQCCRWGNCTNTTDCRDWWNYEMPGGEADARIKANERMAEAMKEIAESRIREAKADADNADRMESLYQKEKERQDELLAETTMNTTENGWWDLPRWNPENQTDHNVSIGYPAPAPPKEWLDIHGPNATSSYDNVTGSMRIAYDEEGYPKPWADANNTQLALDEVKGQMGMNSSRDRTLETQMQDEYDSDVRQLDFTKETRENELRESRSSTDTQNVEILDDFFDPKELQPSQVTLPSSLLNSDSDGAAEDPELLRDQDMTGLLGNQMHIRISPSAGDELL